MPAWPFALACLPAGFAVAEATGVRPVGGAVMVLVALPAVLGAEPRRALAWAGVALGGFAASHALADAFGAWGAVACAAAVTGLAGLVLLDRAAPARA